MVIRIGFRALVEDSPGERWQASFEQLWPGYFKIEHRETSVARP